MQHLDEGTVHAWLDGALSAEQSADVERHVAECQQCAALVAEARGVVAGASRIVSALDVVPRGVIPGGVAPKTRRGETSSKSLWRSLRLTPSRAALAATLVIAASTLLTLRHDTPSKLVPMAAPSSPTVASASTPALERRDSGVGERPKAAVAPASSKVARADRREAAPDVRIRVTDSTSPAPSAKRAVAPVAAQNVASGSAAAADGARPAAKVVGDSTQQQLFRAAAAPGLAPRRFQVAEGVRQTRDLVSGLSGDGLAGCYQIVGDSALKDSSIPRRFALAPPHDDTTENIVHTATPDGRMGDAIVGSRWTQTSPNTMTIQVPVLGRPQSFTIRLRTGTAMGVATIVGDQGPTPLTVRHTSCLP
jgi:hypothetical protein